MRDEEPIEIVSRDYWFKIVEFLQHNWALVDVTDAGVQVWFIGDPSGVFDSLRFATVDEATVGLRRNGFRRFDEDSRAQSFLSPPRPPFRRSPHPNGPIYSSGRFWK